MYCYLLIFILLSVKQVGRKCSKEAILTAQARLPARQMTEIFGEDEGNTQETLALDLESVASKLNRIAALVNAELKISSFFGYMTLPLQKVVLFLIFFQTCENTGLSLRF